MDQYVILVDAGYLYINGSTETARLPGSRAAKALPAAIAAAAGINPAQERLLRTHWYDGLRPGQDPPAALLTIPGLKFEAGRINTAGKQKGVDAMIVLGLVRAAHSPRITTIYLVSGDDDLTAAVEYAQEVGMRVVSVSVGPKKSTSRRLMATCDAHIALPAPFWSEPAQPATKRTATTATSRSGTPKSGTPKSGTPEAGDAEPDEPAAQVVTLRRDTRPQLVLVDAPPAPGTDPA